MLLTPLTSTGYSCVKSLVCLSVGSPGGSAGNNLPANTGDAGSMPGLGRSPGNPLQYSCLGNPTDRGAWRAVIPQPFWHQEQFRGRQFFYGPGLGWGDGFRMTQAHHIYSAFYFCSNVIADLTGGTSPLPRGWGPLSCDTIGGVMHFTLGSHLSFQVHAGPAYQ